MSWPWGQLGLPGPSGLSEVRRAYAEKLKTTHPEEDPEGFQRLHAAYQQASRMARQQRKDPTEPVPHMQQPASRPEPEKLDSDSLLQTEDHLLPPRRPPERDFDYDRLLAEGEAERAEERRRRGEERRKIRETERKPSRVLEARAEQEGWARLNREQLQWQNTESILHTIEMIYSSRAGGEVWRKFFQSPLFQQNRSNLDLIFGLEDFVSTHQDLPQEAKAALFTACGFDKGVSRPELRPLFQMLLPAWKAERKASAFPWKSMLLGFLGAFAFLFGIGPVLDSGVLPIVLAGLGLGAVLCIVGKAIRLGTREKRFRGQPVSRKQERLAVLQGVMGTAAILLVLCWLRSYPELSLRGLRPSPDPREQVCRYLEEDYGEKFRSLYNGDDSRFDNVFSPWNETGRMFLAGPDGSRDKKSGKLGYTTNYPEMMVLWRLKEFARERNIDSVQEVDEIQGLGPWETSGTYLIPLKPCGDEEVITGLQALLEAMAQEDWYSVRSPEFEVILCSGPLKDGRLVLARWKPAGEAFDADAVCALYEDSFAHAYCAQLLRDNELDRDFVHGGTEPYTLTNGGKAELKGEERFRINGLDEAGQVAMEYYFSTTAGSVCCVPGGFWEKGGREEDIQFYRLIHVEATAGLFLIYYPLATIG